MRRSIALLLAPFFVACSDSSTLRTDAGDTDADVTMDAGMDAAVYEDEIVAPPAPPVCTNDANTGHATFTVSTIEIPKPTDVGGIGGFNIDNRISTDVSVPGCFYIDEPGGVDNAFAYVVKRLNAFVSAIPQGNDHNGNPNPPINIYAEISKMIERGELQISLELTHWNEMRDDDAVTATIRITVGAQTQETTGCGRMVDGTLEGTFGEALPLAIVIDGRHIALVLRSPRIRLVLGQDLTSIDASKSFVGGIILWDDGTETDVVGEMRVEIEGLLNSVAGSLGLDQNLVDTIVHSVGTDMDLDGYPTQMPCALTESQDLTADSFSVGFRLGGTRNPVAGP